MYRLIVFLFVTSLLCAQTQYQLGDVVIDGGRGDVPVHVPNSYDPAQATPLIMLLHGYTGTGQQTEDIIQFTPLAEEFGFIYLFPDGSTDLLGNQFWNATDACCDLFNTGIDDESYLIGLIDILAETYNVNPYRVYLIGHSNGGFMSYRLACDQTDRIAAIVSVAGATYFNAPDCDPANPIHVLQIHGTLDGTINYEGGFIGTNAYPGAVQTVETWAFYNDCLPTPDESHPDIDIEADLPGEETSIADYVTDCLPGGSASLWTMDNGIHIPNFQTDAPRRIVEYLYAHPKAAALCVEPIWSLAVNWRGDSPDSDHNQDGLVNILDGAGLVENLCALN